MQTRRMETREVLGGANPRPNTAMLTHAVMQMFRGGMWEDAEVLCKRVDILNLADGNAGNDVHAEPTCKSCRAAWRRIGRVANQLSVRAK